MFLSQLEFHDNFVHLDRFPLIGFKGGGGISMSSTVPRIVDDGW